MFDHILIAYDGSEPAERALEASAQLVLGLQGRLTLLHCRLRGSIPQSLRAGGTASVQTDPGRSESDDRCDVSALELEEVDRIGHGLVDAAVATLRARGVTNYQAVITGEHGSHMTGAVDPARVIRTYAENHGVDTIVLGARGLGILQGAVLGSVSQKILHTFNGGVLTIR